MYISDDILGRYFGMILQYFGMKIYYDLNWEKNLFWINTKLVYLIFIPNYRSIIPK